MQIGIDLGTTNSAMAYVTEDDESEVIINSDGENTTPSVVLIEEDEDEPVTVGASASRMRELYPNRTLERTKQDMGTDTTYEVDGVEYTPQRVAGYVLEKLKEDAKDHLGVDEIDSAVITVPYYFGDEERKATRTAAESFADLDVEKIINEPTAACLAYSYDKEIEGTFLVYDLGGGTFDATLMTSRTTIEVVGTEGSQTLGGENFDDELYDHVREKLLDDGHADPDDNDRKRANLRSQVKQAKHDLSNRPEVTFAFDPGDGMAEVQITREEFDEVTGELVERTIENIDRLFEDVEEDPEDVDEVLMVGGSTRIPLVQQRVEEYFGMEPRLDTNPDTVVARGAALETAFFRDDVDTTDLPELPVGGVVDVLSHSLGVETHDGSFDPIFTRFDEVPDDKGDTYTNPEDGVENIIVRVQEKRENSEDGDVEFKELGEFELKGIEPQPAGEARIDVTFDITEDGTLTVSAVERDSGVEEELTVDENIGLTDKEIEDQEEETPDYRPQQT